MCGVVYFTMLSKLRLEANQVSDASVQAVFFFFSLFLCEATPLARHINGGGPSFIVIVVLLSSFNGVLHHTQVVQRLNGYFIDWDRYGSNVDEIDEVGIC